MKACGLIVEYNPFHNGHQYHVDEAKKTTNADCMIAVMSGTFLQRGEPAIIDKFHRTKAALASGVDIVVELPYVYAVQSSHYFAKGALLTLDALQTDMICFGSESGEIKPFYDGVSRLHKHRAEYDQTVQSFLQKGLSYPSASSKAYQEIGMEHLDLFQPNNILGFSYVKTIVENNLSIQATTIQRKSSHFHDENIEDTIASATSIRKELALEEFSQKVASAIPEKSITQIKQYKEKATLWHDWEHYYPLLHYRLTTMSREELALIHGVDEGIEGRLLNAIHTAKSFQELIDRVKTKRYTQVRLQRMFVHILTNTTKKQINDFYNLPLLPYVRLLGMTKQGRAYLHQTKKSRTIPVVTNLNSEQDSLYLDERALNVYYSVLPVERRLQLRNQEFKLPIILT
ncbi:MAG TPA: nucleotidyltransferase [Pseudogracilibacillus sp.]|nr:nucleotidyltransferase [Pseudogracilibacillus sp.]